MTKKRAGDAQRPVRPGTPPHPDSPREYEDTLLLERLESLIEEMDELGVKSREEAADRADELRERLDQP